MICIYHVLGFPVGCLSILLPADKHNKRFSMSSNSIMGSVSCIDWPFHL